MSAYQRDELQNVVERYPVWPGDTVSHPSMDRLRDLGYAVRQDDGSWIPTAAGLEEWDRARWEVPAQPGQQSGDGK